MARQGWTWLDFARHDYTLLVMAGNSQQWHEMASNGWKFLEIAGNGLTWQEMDDLSRNYLKCLEMPGIGQQLLEITGNSFK